MLELNWSTLLLQIANFLIMTYILTRFLFKPLKKMLDKRAKHATKAMDEAEQARREAKILKQEYNEKTRNIDAEFAALKNEARIVIDQTRQQMLQEAYEEIEAMRKRAQEEIEQQRAEALRIHRNKVGDVVTALVQRMMKDILNPQIHQAYLDNFLDHMRSVQLNGRISNNDEETLPADIVTAIPLESDEQRQIRAILETVVDYPLDMTYRIDPDLIAGAMVRLGDTLIDGSLQGQLRQLRNRYEEEVE